MLPGCEDAVEVPFPSLSFVIFLRLVSPQINHLFWLTLKDTVARFGCLKCAATLEVPFTSTWQISRQTGQLSAAKCPPVVLVDRIQLYCMR